MGNPERNEWQAGLRRKCLSPSQLHTQRLFLFGSEWEKMTTRLFQECANGEGGHEAYLLERLLVDLHDHVGVHVEEAPVGVVREALVSRGIDDALFHQKNEEINHERRGSAAILERSYTRIENTTENLSDLKETPAGRRE